MIGYCICCVYKLFIFEVRKIVCFLDNRKCNKIKKKCYMNKLF